MLVLSRKIGESIVVGDETTIRVLSIAGNKIRLGIEAPDWVRVMRTELLNPADPPGAPSPPPSLAPKSR